MKKSLVTSILFLSAGIVLGGGGMSLVHVSTSANSPLERPETSVENNTSRSFPVDHSQLNGGTLGHILSNNQSVASLEDPKLHTDSFQRRLAIYTYVAGLSVEELTNELQETSRGSQKLSHRVLDELEAALVERLAIVDPETAVKFAVAQKAPEPNLATRWYSWQDSSGEAEPVYMPVVHSVFSDWALSDLSSAISKAKSLRGDAKSNALTGILATQAGQSLTTHRQIARELGDEERGVDSYVESFSTRQIDDPKAAWDEVIALLEPSNFRQSRAILNIAGQWFEKDGFNVLDEISESNVDSNIKSHVIKQLLSQTIDDNPEQAFQFALKMPNEGRFSPTLNSVVNTWSESDPQAALQAVNSVEKSGLREQLQRIVARNWASNEPRYVLENLDIFPRNIQDQVRNDAIGSIARTSPKEAAKLALELSGGMWVEYLASQVMREWLEQDVEAAINWVYNGPGNEDSRYIWVSALTSYLVVSDPRRAFELAVQQEIPEDTGFMGMAINQHGLEASVISQIVFQNLDLAVELLPRVREGITKTAAYFAIGSRYIEEGHSTKALNLGLKLPNEGQVNYFQSIARPWARIDPAGLVESVKELPTEETRSSVASILSNRWYRENFTEEQVDTLKQYLSDSDRNALESQQ